MTITKETIYIGAGCLIGLAIIGAVRQGQRKKMELRDREILEETIRTVFNEQNDDAATEKTEETVEADKEDSKK